MRIYDLKAERATRNLKGKILKVEAIVWETLE